MPYVVTKVSFASQAPPFDALAEALQRITGQPVASDIYGDRATLVVDAFTDRVDVEVLDEQTWSVDFNALHPYLAAALRLALHEVGAPIDAPQQVRPWAQTHRWWHSARRGLRLAATPLFIASELAVALVLLPVLAVRGIVRRGRTLR